jgi:hypothetical protein
MKVKKVNNSIVYNMSFDTKNADQALKKVLKMLNDIDKKINKITIKALFKIWLACQLKKMLKRLEK